MEFIAVCKLKGKIDGKNPKEWFDFMFDHTVLIAEDDPFVKAFDQMASSGVAQVRIVPATGAEQFSKLIYDKVNL